jgi:hypothetical protein
MRPNVHAAFTIDEQARNRPFLRFGGMTYPFFATPYPDEKVTGPIFGSEQRAIVGVMVRNPGRVLTPDELCGGLTPMSRTPRRMDTLIGGIRDALGPDAVVAVPRRGWTYLPSSTG